MLAQSEGLQFDFGPVGRDQACRRGHVGGLTCEVVWESRLVERLSNALATSSQDS